MSSSKIPAPDFPGKAPPHDVLLCGIDPECSCQRCRAAMWLPMPMSDNDELRRKYLDRDEWRRIGRLLDFDRPDDLLEMNRRLNALLLERFKDHVHEQIVAGIKAFASRRGGS